MDQVKPIKEGTENIEITKDEVQQELDDQDLSELEGFEDINDEQFEELV